MIQILASKPRAIALTDFIRYIAELAGCEVR
jgi:hypothetical protein